MRMCTDSQLIQQIAAAEDRLCEAILPGPVDVPAAKIHAARRLILKRLLTAEREEPMVQAILDANVTKLLADETLKIHQETERRWKEGK